MNRLNEYLIRGVIESNIDYIKSYHYFTCMAKIYFDFDLDDAFTFKDVINYLHQQTEYAPILHAKEEGFILFFRDYKIHQAKATMQKIKREIWQRFNINIEIIALTLLDPEDTYESLLKRLDEYYVMSKLSTNKKIFYGTKDFSFYESANKKNALKSIFKKSNKIKLHNMYKGLPILDEANILGFDGTTLLLQIESKKLSFYQKESFTHLQHDLVPNIIKADILRVLVEKNTITLGGLELLDSSPVERSGIRIEPSKKILAGLSIENKKLCDGTITNISEGSIVIQSNMQQIERLMQSNVGSDYLKLQFQLPTQQNFLTTIKVKATLFNIINEQIVLTIYPTPTTRTKIRAYLSKEQSNLLIHLKKQFI